MWIWRIRGVDESRAIIWSSIRLMTFSAVPILSGATAIFAREGLRLLFPLVGPGSVVEAARA